MWKLYSDLRWLGSLLKWHFPVKAKGLILMYLFYFWFVFSSGCLRSFLCFVLWVIFAPSQEKLAQSATESGSKPWLVLAGILWCKEGYFKYHLANGITHKSILLPKKEHKIRWVNLRSERWANLLYCYMILNPFPFPAMKELSEVHLLHFPSLCSSHNNYFSVLRCENKHISSLRKGGRRKDFSTKIRFAPWILHTMGGSQRQASWAWVIPHDWCHPPGLFRPLTMWFSLHKSLSFLTDYRGSHQQLGSWSRWLSDCRNPSELDCSLRVTKQTMNRRLLFRIQRCIFSLSQAEPRLNAVFIFLISRDITHVPRHEISKKEGKDF